MCLRGLAQCLVNLSVSIAFRINVIIGREGLFELRDVTLFCNHSPTLSLLLPNLLSRDVYRLTAGFDARLKKDGMYPGLQILRLHNADVHARRFQTSPER